MKAVCAGAGKLGYELAKRMAEEGHDVVVIDSDPDALREAENNLDVMTIEGSATSVRVLEKAGVKDRVLFVAVTDSDEVNIISGALAKKLGANTTIARIRNPEYHELESQGLLQKKFGVDIAINSDEAVAYEIAKVLKAPAATEVHYFADGRVQMLGYKIQSGSPIAGKTVKDANLTSCTIGAVFHGGRAVVPYGNTVLHPGDHIMVIGKTGAPTGVGWLVGKADQGVRNVAIAGGGPVGLRVAQILEKHRPHGFTVKLIERSHSICQDLASRLSQTVIVNGDPTRPYILREENIGAVDAFIAVTEQEQANLLCGFTAKHLGAKRVIVELQREDYIPIAERMGMDVTVIPRIIVASTVLRLLSKANVVALSLLKEGNLHVMEIVLPEGCKAARKRLKNLDLPREVTVGALVRSGAVVVPRGDTLLMPGDHLVVFAAASTVPTVEELLRSQVRE